MTHEGELVRRMKQEMGEAIANRMQLHTALAVENGRVTIETSGPTRSVIIARGVVIQPNDLVLVMHQGRAAFAICAFPGTE